jgi:hypothetical protein
MSGDDRVHLVVYNGATLAIVGPTRCHVLMSGLDAPTLRFALTMCLYNGEVEAGRAPGPFSSERAEQWARWVLLGQSLDLLRHGNNDSEVAGHLQVPVEQVALARGELRSSSAAGPTGV